MKERFINYSILLSAASILLTVVINYEIATAFIRSSGKTRALFGIKELLQFSYQYYVAGIGVLSLILAFIGKSSNSFKKYFAILFSLAAIIIVFIRIWRLFI